MYVLFMILLTFWAWLVSMSHHDLLIFACFSTIVYFGMKIFMNLAYDTDAEIAARENTRQHFSRPSFRMWVDKEGKLHVKSGDNPDHATRCQNSMREWAKIESRLKWNNWIYFAWIIAACLTLNWIGK